MLIPVIGAFLTLAATPSTSPDLAGDALGARELAYYAYQTCLRENIQRLLPLHSQESAETIVRASEHYCMPKWVDLDLKIHREAIYSGIDGGNVAREWRYEEHNAALALILEIRVPASSPTHQPASM